MNRCEYYRENMSAYLDGVLPEKERNDMEEHLKKCASCSREFEILKTIVSTCNELEEELPEGFSSSLHARLEEARNEVPAGSNRTGKIRLFAQIAAGFIIVVTLGFAVRTGFFSNKHANGTATAGESMSVAASPDNVEYQALEGYFAAAEETTEESEAAGEGKDLAAAQRIMENQDGSPDGEQEDSGSVLQFSSKTETTTDKEEQHHGTEITVVVDDIEKAVRSIMEIDEKIGKSRDGETLYNRDSNCMYRGSKRNDCVEIKLVYTSEEAQQSFLEQMKSAFSDIQVESVSSENEGEDGKEYIKIIIEKKK